MAKDGRKLVVIGHGAAGLAAALAAAEAARDRHFPLRVTVLEKALQAEAGGNTRWSPSYMRMAATDRVAPDFEHDMELASGGRADQAYFRTLAANAAATIGWLQRKGVEFSRPVYYLSAGPPRIQPNGGGRTIIERLSEAALQAGVQITYGCEAMHIAADERCRYVLKTAGDHGERTMEADAIVLASGGFQGSPDMMRTHFGPAAATMKLISPGTRFDTGDGIRLAQNLGASPSGDWNGMHAEPIDPRSQQSAPVVLVYPYGIVVDRNGQRFFDEGGGLVHETWEAFARDIHFSRPGSIAYAILDSRLFEISGFERAIRSEVPPYQAATLDALAAMIDVPADALKKTVKSFNEAASGDPTQFDATSCDGLATDGLTPPKSNWARPITKPPFIAYPLVGAIAYTFGGVASNQKAEVLGDDGIIPGLYAAGEVTGQFYATAPNAVAMLRATVFGKIAGEQAVDFLARKQQSG
ncbi:MAG TPA: FAD-binding protein [Bradyrhizobium sp.]|nr:FAD-binding protein [Bradyrhizobium sp.]